LFQGYDPLGVSLTLDNHKIINFFKLHENVKILPQKIISKYYIKISEFINSLQLENSLKWHSGRIIHV